jgi:hypothetical protein
MPRPRRSLRTPSTLPAPLHQRLSAYALAAGAAGVSLVALAQPSEAEVVYTPVDETIARRGGSYKLDLNHDGIIDFVLVEHATKNSLGGTFQSFGVAAAPNNRVKCLYPFCLSTDIYAAALQPGNEISSRQQPHGWLPVFAQMAAERRNVSGASYFDTWVNAHGLYLGLRFQINGETHFGWAQLSVKFHGGLPKDRTWEAHLTGYAYETTANKAIAAGQTTDAPDDDAASPNPAHSGTIIPAAGKHAPAKFASLGALALGTEGLALWRREESESGSNKN